MKDVWKEFFRLKWEEIWSFVCVLPKVVLFALFIIFGIIGVAIVTIAITYVFGYLIILIFNGNLDFDSIMGYGSCFLLGLLCGFLIIYATMKWFKSNWKQANKNVEDRNERPKTA